MKLYAEKDGQKNFLAKVVFIFEKWKFSMFRRITIYPEVYLNFNKKKSLIKSTIKDPEEKGYNRLRFCI
jgi:hypothetical protein